MGENFRHIERLFDRSPTFRESEQAPGQVSGAFGALAGVIEIFR